MPIFGRIPSRKAEIYRSIRSSVCWSPLPTTLHRPACSLIYKLAVWGWSVSALLMTHPIPQHLYSIYGISGPQCCGLSIWGSCPRISPVNSVPLSIGLAVKDTEPLPDFFPSWRILSTTVALDSVQPAARFLVRGIWCVPWRLQVLFWVSCDLLRLCGVLSPFVFQGWESSVRESTFKFIFPSPPCLVSGTVELSSGFLFAAPQPSTTWRPAAN